MAEPTSWPDALALVQGAMAAALRRDDMAVEAAVALIPASKLRGSMVALLEAFAAALLSRHADPEVVGRELAQVFVDGLLTQAGDGDG